MASFTSIRASSSQLDLSAKHKLRFNSLKATSMKDLYNDDISSDRYTPANKNSNNNKQRLLLDHCDVTQSPDYRTFLLMRRPPSKIPNRFSDDSCDSDITEDELSTDEIVTETTGDSQPPLVVQSATSHISKRESDKALAQQLDSTEQALLKIVVAEQKLTKCLRVDMEDTPWLVKQRIIQTLAKKLPDPLNYGFYCKKLGRFLLDHKPMREYLEVGGVATYELRYKRRVFQQTLRSAKESRHLLKMQGSSKRRELMGYVRGRGVDKVHALIRKGVDPNFHSATGDETPLIAASSGHKDQRTCAPIIMALVGGGAHLDFRDRRGRTPVHAAVRGGNVSALKTLLDLGASPDGFDSKDLTPLYHCCLVDDNVECLSVLIHVGCKNTCVDSQGWTVLHQVCRHGRLEQLKLLLQSCSDDQQLINKQNATGNTALHVCSLYNQEMCLVTLLKHNADSSICNYANQDPYQVAIVAGNVNLGQLIKDIEHGNNDHPLLKPTILDMLPPVEGTGIHRRHTVSVASLPNGKPQRPTLGTSFSKQSTGTRYDTHLPPNATLPTYDVTINHDDITRDRIMTSQPILREEIRDSDEASDILFIVCRDYEPLVPGELSLKLGDRVAVRHKEVCDGFAVGSVGGKTGRFPLNCVQAVKLRRSKLDFKHLKHEQHSLDSCLHEDDTTAMTSSEVTSQPGVSHKYRDVIITRGVEGYGFVLRGAKSEGPIGRFIPSPRQPALQYLESVELGSNAHEAGLRSGDFVLKINNADVSTIGHREIVERIQDAGDPLRVFVVAVGEVNDDIISMTSSTTSSNDMTSSGIPPTQNHEKISRSGSIGSAIGKLDSVLALEEGSEDDYDVIKQTATLRRRPVSRMLRSHDIQDIFLRNHPPPPRHSQSLSSATSRRLIRVLPPKLPHPASPNDDACDCDISDTSSVTSQGSTFMSDTMTSSMTSSTTSSFTVSRHSSNAAVPLTSRKPPPAPPQRRSSRLTTTSRDEEELRQLRNNIVTSSPPLSPLSPKSPGSKPTKREISIAAAVAAKALTRNHEGKSPKPTSPKGGDNQSALAMALAAKRASLHLVVDTTSGVKPSDVAKALRRNEDKQSERVSLPPPPPTPPSESGGLGEFTLPPPPDPHGHMTFDDVINLPPPPDDMMGEFPTLPPPTSFAGGKGNTPKPTKTKGDLVTSSAHDSGVDDVIIRTSAPKSIETISVVSSTSNISSEEGSDPGVSLAYDKGEAPITLTKVNFGLSEVATPVVCDITRKPLHEWNVAEVGRWLVGIGLGSHAGKFADNEIDGSHLPQLGKDELSELGVTRVGHRLNFERSLKKLS